MNVLKKCNVLEKAMQLSVHDQHDAVVEIKYGKEFRFCHAKFRLFIQ